MPNYPSFASDLHSARQNYLRDPRFVPAFEENYLKNLTLALDELEAAGQITLPNRVTLTLSPLNNYHFAEDFKKLRLAGILNQATFNLLLSHIEHSALLTEGCLLLQQGGILAENLSLLAQAPSMAPLLAQGLLALNQAGLSHFKRSFLLVQFPQLIPSLLLLNQNSILNRTSLGLLVVNLSFIEGLHAALNELHLAGFLNKDSFQAANRIAPEAASLSLALRELRQTTLFEENYVALFTRRKQLEALGSAFFNFNYGEVPLSQKDLDLLFKFPEQAEALSYVMITLSHQNLLETYRPALNEQGQRSETLLKLMEKLRRTSLLTPPNLEHLFQVLQYVEPILAACEKQSPLSQLQFDNILGRIRAERRIHLSLGRANLFEEGKAPLTFFAVLSKPAADKTTPAGNLEFKLF
jgi:hypothetical protein